MSIQVPLSRIDDNPYQTRQSYDDETVRDLAASIEKDGLIQIPPARLVDETGGVIDALPSWSYETAFGAVELVRTLENSSPSYYPLSVPEDVERLLETYEGWRVQLAVGHRRRRAYEHLARTSDGSFEAMPVELRPLSGEQMDMLAWSENHQRDDLNAVEEAMAIRDRIERRGWTHEEAGAALGLSRSAVSNKLRLLRLPEEVLEHVASGALSERQGLALVPAFHLNADAQDLLTWAEEEGLFVPNTPERVLRVLRKGEMQTYSSDQLRHALQARDARLEVLAEERARREQADQGISKPVVGSAGLGEQSSDDEELPDDVGAGPLEDLPESGGYFVAYDARDSLIWGCGDTEEEALEDAQEWTVGFGDVELCTVPASLELIDTLDTEGGQGLVWHLDADGVAQLGAGGTKTSHVEPAQNGHQAGSEEPPAQNYATTWPQPRLDPVWQDLGSMTKAELEETHKRFRQNLWYRYWDNFRTSDLKASMLAHVTAQVRFHANLEACMLLSDDQAEALHAWMRKKTDGEHFWGEQYGFLRPARSVLDAVRDAETLGTFSEAAMSQFRRTEARRAGAFCYHLFLKDQQSGVYHAEREAVEAEAHAASLAAAEAETAGEPAELFNADVEPEPASEVAA